MTHKDRFFNERLDTKMGTHTDTNGLRTAHDITKRASLTNLCIFAHELGKERLGGQGPRQLLAHMQNGVDHMGREFFHL